MAYVRKTEDEYNIEMNTQYGWEMVNCETTWKDARRSIKEYRENQPGSYRIKTKRVPIKAA